LSEQFQNQAKIPHCQNSSKIKYKKYHIVETDPKSNKKYHIVRNCSDNVVFLLDFGTVPTMWYFLFDFGTVLTMWYFLFDFGTVPTMVFFV
jgi:hypothetical protein